MVRVLDLALVLAGRPVSCMLVWVVHASTCSMGIVHASMGIAC